MGAASAAMLFGFARSRASRLKPLPQDQAATATSGISIRCPDFPQGKSDHDRRSLVESARRGRDQSTLLRGQKKGPHGEPLSFHLPAIAQ